MKKFIFSLTAMLIYFLSSANENSYYESTESQIFIPDIISILFILTVIGMFSGIVLMGAMIFREKKKINQ